MKKTLHSIRAMLLMVCLFPMMAVAAAPFNAKVVHVSDGDTVTVLTDQDKEVKIRLSEIDTPEKAQPWGSKAKQAMSDLVAGKRVEVRPASTDRYGRTIAHLWIDGTSVAHELVKQGHAWVYRRYAEDKSLFMLEREARKAARGLWSLPKSERQKPWEWRREHGKSK